MFYFYLRSLLILSLFLYSCAMKYAWVPPHSSNISLIPDPKYHSFVQSIVQTESIVKKVTPADPVLRGCTVNRVYEAFLRQGQPRTEILTLFQEKRGEFLVNVTINGSNVYVNGKFYVTLRYQMKNVTEIDLDKHPTRTRVWSVMELAGDIKFMPPEYEWVYINVDGISCSEVKIKVVEGYAELVFLRNHMAFPAESYDDVFFLPTSTSIVTSSAPTTLQGQENELNENEKEVQKASIITALICAGCAILLLIAVALLSFVGCRLGRWHARKQALKKGFIKVNESVASITPDTVENKPTEAAITPALTELHQPTKLDATVASRNASSPPTG